VCQQAFDVSRQCPIHSAVVSDRAAVSACLQFADDHRVVVEPACGAALAAVYERLPALDAFSSVLVVVCGGDAGTVAGMDSEPASVGSIHMCHRALPRS
jgi:L-serine/L-threonine ammonia-lyase